MCSKSHQAAYEPHIFLDTLIVENVVEEASLTSRTARGVRKISQLHANALGQSRTLLQLMSVFRHIARNSPDKAKLTLSYLQHLKSRVGFQP